MGLFEGTPLTEAEVRENAIKTDHCAWCGKVVVWGTFPKSGKRASCERSRYGMLILSDEGFWTPYRNEHGDRQRYLTHWELCPRADEARAADKDFGETE